MKTINYESDFKIREKREDGTPLWNAPFRFTYYVKMSRGTFVASYDGRVFNNCHQGTGDDEGKLIVAFDEPKFGTGVLRVKREFFLNDHDFADGVRHYVSDEATDIVLDKGATSEGIVVDVVLNPSYYKGDRGYSAYEVWLNDGNQGSIEEFFDSLRGDKGDTGVGIKDVKQTTSSTEDGGRNTITVTLDNGNYYEFYVYNGGKGSKGDKGDALTYEDLSQEQKEDLAYQVIGDAEAERRKAEVERQQAEEQREKVEAIRQTNENVRIIAEGARESAEAQRKEAEQVRETAFITNENARQTTFETNEANRQAAFEVNEAERQSKELERQQAEAIRQESYKDKVDKDDYAPLLTSGFAENLVGRGDATSREITFTPTAGDVSIGDGVAHIDRIKGNTVVWNQFAPTDLSSYSILRTGNYTVVDGIFTGTANTANNTAYIYLGNSFISNHKGRKLYCSAEIKADNTIAKLFVVGMGVSVFVQATGDWQKVENIYTNNIWAGAVIGAGVSVTDTLVTYSVRNICYYDLTQMFGEGNEPTTVEEFHRRKPLGIDEYAYNEGELISTNVEGLKSVGFNAWDEEWELGAYSNTTGNKSVSSSNLRNSNIIPVLSGQEYLVEASASIVRVYYYDENKTYISYETLMRSQRKFTTPNKCSYINFYTNNTTYNNDICIHLVHTGYRNGEYEPYKEFRRSLPIAEIKDKDGNQLFPNGLLSAGNVYDEITATKAIKRIGVVDLGTLTYTFNAANGYYYSEGFIQANFADSLNNLACSHYITKHWGGAGGFTLNYAGDRDTCVAIWKSTISQLSMVNILDDSVADAAELMAMLKENNVMLYYELAEPIEVDLEEPLNFDYEVSDFGTEEIVSSGPTTPMKADIIYQFNAVDRIRDNSRHTAEADKKLLDYESRIAALEAMIANLTREEDEVFE